MKFFTRSLYVFAVAVSLAGIHANAQPITDQNSSATFSASSGGLTSWSVDGQNQLALQNLWYRIGAGNNLALGALGAPVVSQPLSGLLTATYTGAGFTLAIKYDMTGSNPGNGAADIGETITIQNTSGSALSFVLYQYSDFDLGQNPMNDTASLGVDTSTGKIVSLNQQKGTMVACATLGSVVTPEANGGQVDATGGLYAQLGTGAYSLNNNLGPAGGPTSDVAAALQWNLAINAGKSLIISEDNTINGVTAVPEPALLALISSGLAAFGLCRRQS